jgi:hypothetical protein
VAVEVAEEPHLVLEDPVESEAGAQETRSARPVLVDGGKTPGIYRVHEHAEVIYEAKRCIPIAHFPVAIDRSGP